jgi:site-specific recombinase XerD
MDMLKLARRYTAGRIERRDVKRVTAMRQHGVLARFAESYGRRDPKNLSRVDIERWIAERAPHLAVGTRRFEISTLRQFCRWLQRERYVRHDPMLEIKPPRVPRRVPRALSSDQDAAIEAVLPDARAWAIYALLRLEGLRRCEVISLQVGDWNRDAHILHVTGKGDHQRDIPVTARAAQLLSEYVRETGANAGPLIRKNHGRGPISNSWIGILMRGWMEEAGVKERPHDGKGCHSLRHTLASNVADEEPDLRVVQDLLGHADLSSTQIYLRRAKLDKIRAAMESAA